MDFRDAIDSLYYERDYVYKDKVKNKKKVKEEDTKHYENINKCLETIYEAFYNQDKRFLSVQDINKEKRYIIRVDQIVAITTETEGIKILLSNGTTLLVSATYHDLMHWIDRNIGFI